MSKLWEVEKDKSSFHKPRIQTKIEEDSDSLFNNLCDHFKYDFDIDYSSSFKMNIVKAKYYKKQFVSEDNAAYELHNIITEKFSNYNYRADFF